MGCAPDWSSQASNKATCVCRRMEAVQEQLDLLNMEVKALSSEVTSTSDAYAEAAGTPHEGVREKIWQQLVASLLVGVSCSKQEPGATQPEGVGQPAAA